MVAFFCSFILLSVTAFGGATGLLEGLHLIVDRQAAAGYAIV